MRKALLNIPKRAVVGWGVEVKAGLKRLLEWLRLIPYEP